MEPINITFDISKLDTPELEQLQAILYRYGYMNECAIVDKRRCWILYS